MNIVFTILTILAVIASVLLVIVILLQNSKGEGLASNFVAGNQTFGVRKTADLLEKFTWWLVSFVLIIAIISSFTIGSNSHGSELTKEIEQAATEQPAFPSQVNPQATTTEEAAQKPTEPAGELQSADPATEATTSN